MEGCCNDIADEDKNHQRIPVVGSYTHHRSGKGCHGNEHEHRKKADIRMLLNWMRCYKEVLMDTLDEMGKSLIKDIETLSRTLPPEKGTFNSPPK